MLLFCSECEHSEHNGILTFSNWKQQEEIIILVWDFFFNGVKEWKPQYDGEIKKG